MEAKRRRSEKQRSSREKMEVMNLLDQEEKKQAGRANNIGMVGPPLALQTWVASARQATLGGGSEAVGLKGKGSGRAAPFSLGSRESQGGSSSSMSELENKPLQGASSSSEARSSGSTQSLQDQYNPEAIVSSGTKTSETSRTPRLEVETLCKTVENRGKERASTIEDMPSVFTKGEGPNGKRIEGILYKYGKGDEVRIMCICHGNFLSPAEFVKHADGGDVDHPLRHIVLNPSSASLL